MRSSQVLSTLAGLVSLSQAAPAPAPPSSYLEQGQTIEQVHVGYKLLDGPSEMAETYAKFGKAIPEHVAQAANSLGLPKWLSSLPSKALAARDPQVSGTVTATPGSYDSFYLEPVKVGSQTFNLDFDTGSSDLWVLGSSLKGTVSGAAAHTYYTPGSSAAVLSGETWNISYGDGSRANGNVYTDTVSIGAATVTGQYVENAQSASSRFLTETTDGLLGLSFDAINTARPRQAATPFTNLINKGMKALFTCTLKKGKPGSYDFGYIDTAKYSGAITYTPVDSSQGFWMITPSGYSVGSAGTVSASSSVLRGIVDTGTSLLYADNSIVSAYYSKVSGAAYSSSAGGYLFPCSATLPDFTLVINGYKAVVPGSYINYGQYTSTQCFGGIQSDSGIGFAIYGDIFIKSQFIVFDRTQSTPRLGFAPQK